VDDIGRLGRMRGVAPGTDKSICASHTAAFGHRQPITDNAEGRQRAEGADNARAAAQL